MPQSFYALHDHVARKALAASTLPTLRLHAVSTFLRKHAPTGRSTADIDADVRARFLATSMAYLRAADDAAHSTEQCTSAQRAADGRRLSGGA